MFRFVTRYLGVLKVLPDAALIFDAWLRIITVLFHPEVSDHIDNVEKQVGSWPGVSLRIHKYGGLQFNYLSKELGHIHSNGLLDMLLSREIKQQLMAADSRVQNHHAFKNTGWISFYIKTEKDAAYAIKLLRTAYDECPARDKPARALVSFSFLFHFAYKSSKLLYKTIQRVRRPVQKNDHLF